MIDNQTPKEHFIKERNKQTMNKPVYNVILNSNINGVSQREILVAAFAGACQNLDNFNLSDWVKYKDIVTDEDLDAVRKLGR